MPEDADPDDIPSTMTGPWLFLVGEKDSSHAGAKKACEMIPNATLVSLPGLDHVEACFRINLVLPHIRTFLVGMSRV
jgi:hypothetical protein